MTTPKFDLFYEELVMLLDKHKVQLSTTLYDGIEVHDRKEGDPPIYCDFSDHTNPEPTPEPKWVTYEVCHRDFVGDGTKDNLVFWVATKDRSELDAICAVYRTEAHEIMRGDSDIDFHLPRDNDRLKEALS